MIRTTRARLRSTNGFTLIELLVVILVIGVLAGIVVSAVGNANRTANLNACKADVQSLASALQGFKNDNRGYTKAGSSSTVTINDLVAGNYLSSQILQDPNKAYTLTLDLTSTAGHAKVAVGGVGSGTFDADDATSSVDTACRTALGM